MEKFKKITITILCILLAIIFVWGVLFLTSPVVKEWTYGIFGKKQEDTTQEVVYFGYYPDERLDTYKFFIDDKELTFGYSLSGSNETFDYPVVEVEPEQTITCQISDSKGEYWLSNYSWYEITNNTAVFCSPLVGGLGVPNETFKIEIDSHSFVMNLIVGKTTNTLSYSVNSDSKFKLVDCKFELVEDGTELNLSTQLKYGKVVKVNLTLSPSEEYKDKDVLVYYSQYDKGLTKTSHKCIDSTGGDVSCSFEFIMPPCDWELKMLFTFVTSEIIEIPPIINRH